MVAKSRSSGKVRPRNAILGHSKETSCSCLSFISVARVSCRFQYQCCGRGRLVRFCQIAVGSQSTDLNNPPLTNALLTRVHGSPLINRHFSKDRCCSEFFSKSRYSFPERETSPQSWIRLQSTLLNSPRYYFHIKISWGV